VIKKQYNAIEQPLSWLGRLCHASFFSRSASIYPYTFSLPIYRWFWIGLSAAIGAWHGCLGNKQTTTKDFLIAGGKMGVSFFLRHTQLKIDVLLMIDVAYGTQFICYSLFCGNDTRCSRWNLLLWVNEVFNFSTIINVDSFLDGTMYLYFGLWLFCWIFICEYYCSSVFMVNCFVPDISYFYS
jgi:hypothetical protein